VQDTLGLDLAFPEPRPDLSGQTARLLLGLLLPIRENENVLQGVVEVLLAVVEGRVVVDHALLAFLQLLLLWEAPVVVLVLGCGRWGEGIEVGGAVGEGVLVEEVI
jgi:hypothetical protein